MNFHYRTVNSFFRMRPCLRMQLCLSADEVVKRLKSALADRPDGLTATFSKHYVVLRIDESRQHFGSPQLSFEVEDQESGSTLTGLFMPMPSLWTAFMALYGLIVFGGFCGAMYGGMQWQLGHSPWAWWAIPVALFLLVLVYLAACVGQRMGSAQMEELQDFVEQSLSAGSSAARPPVLSR